MARQAYGAGSMSEREPGVWRLRVMVEGKQRERTFRGTEAAARKALRGLSVELPAEVAVAKDHRTVGGLLDEWMRSQRTRGRSPKTLFEYERKIDSRIRPVLGDTPLAELSARDLDRAYERWLAEGLSESSVHHHHAIVSAALSQAVKWDYLEANPAKKATPPANRSERKLITPDVDQVGRLIRTAEETDPVMAAVVALAYVTGARRGELAALRWSDVDLAAGTVTIDKSLCQVEDRVTVKATKTGRGRIFTVDLAARALLERHRAWQEDLSARAESPMVADPYVLSDNANAGRPVAPSKLTDRFTALRGRARLPRGIRLHDLRHANITELIGRGVDVKTVSSRVGHSSATMTLNRYAHALPAGDTRAAEVIGALLPV